MSTPIAGPPVRIEFVVRFQDIDEGLWQACFPPPLEGRFWYENLESSGLEDQFSFRYALVKAGGEAIGIVPCFTHDVPIALVAPPLVAFGLNLLARVFPRAGYQRTFFVGSPCSEAGTIGLLPGVRLADIGAALAAAVRAEARRQRAPMIVFKDLTAADLSALGASASIGGFFRIVSYPGTIVALPAPDKTAYLRSLSHLQRHNLLKKLRRSRELLELETRVVACPSEPELTEILALFQQTYEKGKTKFERLDRRFFAGIAAQPPARFILQRDPKSGELLTFMLVFRLGHRVINKFIGIDYRRAGKTYLYFRLFEAAVDFGYAVGATELQSGQTGYRAKLDLGHALVPLFNLVRHENPVLNAVFRAVGTRVSWKSLDSDLATYLRAHPDADRR